MSLSQESKYPSRRTYVLKLRNDAKPGALAGRLENIVTGSQHAFESAYELLDWIARELASISRTATERTVSSVERMLEMPEGDADANPHQAKKDSIP